LFVEGLTSYDVKEFAKLVGARRVWIHCKLPAVIGFGEKMFPKGEPRWGLLLMKTPRTM
jgi:hypothetical protein